MMAPVKNLEEEYKLIECCSSESLSSCITKLLNEGWNLYGNPCVYVSSGGSSCYTQAMKINRKPHYSNKTGLK